MQLIANNVKIVAKKTQTWKSGDVSYRAQISNGLGGILEVNCSQDLWEQLIPLDQTYDVMCNVETNGYKHYCDLVQVHPA